MKCLVAVILVGAAALGVTQLGRWAIAPPEQNPVSSDARPDCVPRRVVSLAPSITEVLFALGVDDSIAGVTSRCDYPPEACGKPQVGDHFELNYEAIVRLEPDLIVMLPAHDAARRHLAYLDTEIMVVHHDSVEGILESIADMGRICHATHEAESTIREVRERMADVADQAKGRDRPRVLMAIGRDLSIGKIDKICVAGGDAFFYELIALAGGRNAFEGDMPYPWVSAEGIVSLDADVIIDLVGDMSQSLLSREEVAAQWNGLPGCRAVKNRRVHVFDEEYAIIPGPRFVLTLEKLARFLHGKPREGAE